MILRIREALVHLSQWRVRGLEGTLSYICVVETILLPRMYRSERVVSENVPSLVEGKSEPLFDKMYWRSVVKKMRLRCRISSSQRYVEGGALHLGNCRECAMYSRSPPQN